jgi:hypothetical protein
MNVNIGAFHIGPWRNPTKESKTQEQSSDAILGSHTAKPLPLLSPQTCTSQAQQSTAFPTGYYGNEVENITTRQVPIGLTSIQL